MSEVINQVEHQSHALFDYEDRIIKAGNQPSPIDLRFFQMQIDRVAGKTATNKSRCRIVWGQDVEATKMFCVGKFRLKYPFYRELIAGEIEDIGIPRFFIEELHDVDELHKNNAWERSRYSIEGFDKIDVMGPAPIEGFYTEVFEIAYHDYLCCRGREHLKNGEKCHGAFRVPEMRDLDRIEKIIYRRNNAAIQDSAPSPELIQKRTQDMIAKRDEQWRDGIRGVIDDFMKSHGHRFNTFDPVVLKQGKYHQVRGHSKSGLTQDEINKLYKKESSNADNKSVDGTSKPVAGNCEFS